MAKHIFVSEGTPGAQKLFDAKVGNLSGGDKFYVELDHRVSVAILRVCEHKHFLMLLEGSH